MLDSLYPLSEEEAYARMWAEDITIKAKREDMEVAMRLERNKEALKVKIHYLAITLHIDC